MAEERPGTELSELAARVREASLAGRVVPLSEVWPGSPEEFLAALSAEEAADSQDLRTVQEGDTLYLYSELHMTRPYAEAAARSSAGDVLRVVAEAVRTDSATYPRPTPVTALAAAPFLLSREEVLAALAAMAQDEQYADIKLVQASDGTEFLYSTRHLDPDYAASLAEWFAVGQYNSP